MGGDRTMCVYCQEDPSCEHERDSCAASRGEFCPECGHRTAVMKTYTPKPSFPMIQPGRSRKRKPAAKAPAPVVKRARPAGKRRARP